jgi:hypothetical protein
MMSQYRLAIRILLHETTRGEVTSGLKPSRKATDPRKQVNGRQV